MCRLVGPGAAAQVWVGPSPQSDCPGQPCRAQWAALPAQEVQLHLQQHPPVQQCRLQAAWLLHKQCHRSTEMELPSQVRWPAHLSLLASTESELLDTDMDGGQSPCVPSPEPSAAREGDGWDTNDDEAFDDMEDEQQQEIQERMRRLNTRSTHKARPPRLPLPRDAGLERQNSFDSEASLASSQSQASNMTTGDDWRHRLLRWSMPNTPFRQNSLHHRQCLCS